MIRPKTWGTWVVVSLSVALGAQGGGGDAVFAGGREGDGSDWLAMVSRTTASTHPTATSAPVVLTTSAGQKTRPINAIAVPGLPLLRWDRIAPFGAGDLPSVRIGAQIMADFGWISGHQVENLLGEDLDSRFEWRRLRPFVSGKIVKDFEYKLEAEFSGSTPELKDAFLRLDAIPHAGDLTVGHFKEPFSLDELTSLTNLTFLEPDLGNVFVPARSFGVMLNNSEFDNRMTWAGGVFRSLGEPWADPIEQGNAYAATGRVTCLPYYEQGGAKLVHLGLDYSFRLPQDPILYKQRPEAHFTDYFTNTGWMDAQQVHLLDGEWVWQNGPFSMQGEYISAAVRDSSLDNPYFNSAYVQASYFLTGEHRPYDTHTGIFTPILPKKDFLAPGGGLGAWEVAARYSFLDLEAGGLPTSANDVQDFTLGLNWYLTANLRIGMNYIRSWVTGPNGSGAADILVLRLQLAF